MADGAEDEPVSRGSWSSGGRMLAAGAILLMLFAALLPIVGVVPNVGFQVMAALPLLAAVLGGFVLPQGSKVAFMLLWAAFGMAAAVGTIAFFSIGLIYLIAAIFLLFATR